MGEYLKHVSRERARLRHPAFANPQNGSAALAVLQKQPGIAGIKQGPESFLLFLEPDANLDAICGALEAAIPAIKGENTPAARPARRKFSFRKGVLKTYLATGITTVSLAALGFHHWHALFGCVFTAFAIDHVWDRRKAL